MTLKAKLISHARATALYILLMWPCACSANILENISGTNESSLAIIELPSTKSLSSSNVEYVFPSILGETLQQRAKVWVCHQSTIDYANNKLRSFETNIDNGERLKNLHALLNVQWLFVWSCIATNDDYLLHATLYDNKDSPVAHFDLLTNSLAGVITGCSSLMLPALNSHLRMITNDNSVPISLPDDYSLYLYNQGLGAIRTKKPFSIAEQAFANAIHKQPEFSFATADLAVLLAIEGKTAQAKELAINVLKIQPRSARAHYALGIVYLDSRMLSLAEAELKEAESYNPGQADVLYALADCYQEDNDASNALTNYLNAISRAPFYTWAHAKLALCYGFRGLRPEAEKEVELAIALNINDDPRVEETIAHVYELLNDIPDTVKHLEKFVLAMQRQHFENNGIKWDQEHLKLLKESLNMQTISAVEPRRFTTGELEQEICFRLGAKPPEAIINPLAVTDTMTNWAKSCVGSTTDPIEKAHKLFLAILEHIGTTNRVGVRTAEQALGDIDANRTAFSCQEYAFLYVALARSLGLKAYFVIVQRDFSEKVVNHACACVFLQGKAILVDPAYKWFGIPHKEVEILSDVDAVSAFLSDRPDVLSKQLAVKLSPHFAYVGFDLAKSLAQSGDSLNARRALDTALKDESNTWRAAYAEAYVEFYEGNLADSLYNAKRTLKLFPDCYWAHDLLGGIMQLSGNREAAYSEYENYLAFETEPVYIHATLQAIDSLRHDKREPSSIEIQSDAPLW